MVLKRPDGSNAEYQEQKREEASGASKRGLRPFRDRLSRATQRTVPTLLEEPRGFLAQVSHMSQHHTGYSGHPGKAPRPGMAPFQREGYGDRSRLERKNNVQEFRATQTREIAYNPAPNTPDDFQTN